MRRTLCQMLLAAGCWCAGCTAAGGPDQLRDFKVLAHGEDGGGDVCRNFRLTAQQAAWFFSRASVLTAAQQHDRFDYLPCWVRGSASGRGGAWQWEVRAGGTARLVTPDGSAMLMGCDQCDAVLRDKDAAP